MTALPIDTPARTFMKRGVHITYTQLVSRPSRAGALALSATDCIQNMHHLAKTKAPIFGNRKSTQFDFLRCLHSVMLKPHASPSEKVREGGKGDGGDEKVMT